MKIYQIFVLFCTIYSVMGIFDILHFGAVPHSDTVSDQFKNSKAILDAIKAANSSSVERIVRIPAKTFYSFNIRIENVDNLTIIILGKLAASKNVRNWPKKPQRTQYYQDYISFLNCNNIEISGGGKIDGRGYHWWMLLFLDNKKYIPDQNVRPHLIRMSNCRYIKIHDIIMKNAAQFHLKLDSCFDGELYNIAIRVNTTAQINLLKKFSLEGSIIMFPFNTDGIDPSGARFHIYNLTVQNFDDVVVPKPREKSNCTRDMLIENCTVVLGVGMSIGSVPPAKETNCISNITFRNVYMKRPLKGIYVKSNPGNNGYGLIENIIYKNFTMDKPVWWAVYIGPQQMKQPDGDGPGCMLYPFDKKGTCTTNPLVTFNNITLENVKIHKSLLYPYTIRCNISNPCTNINFYNVQTDQWQIGQKKDGYVCQYASGEGRDTYPKLHCLNYTEETIQSDSEKKHKQSFFEAVIRRKFEQYKTLKRIIQQIQKAAHEVGYFEEDDEFDYDLTSENIMDLQGEIVE